MEFNINNETFLKAYNCLKDANILVVNGLGSFSELSLESLSLIKKTSIQNVDRLDFFYSECSMLGINMYNTIQRLSQMDVETANYFNDVLIDGFYDEFGNFLSTLDDGNLKPKNNSVIAHRGLGAVENTAEAFRNAGENGCWGCEADIRFDENGNIVCSHDTVDGNEKPTTFSEYLDICKEYGMTAIVDLKYEVGDDEKFNALSPAVLKIIEEKGMIDSCVLQTNMYKDVSNIRANSSDARIWYLSNEVSDKTVNLIEENNVECLNLKLNGSSTEQIARLNKLTEQNVDVCVWNVQSEETKNRLLKKGATYIMTDNDLGVTPYQDGEEDFNAIKGNYNGTTLVHTGDYNWDAFLLGEKGDGNKLEDNLSDSDSNVNNNANVFGMLYDQSQYKDIKYAGDTLASNGCGFFSVLSAVTAKTGHVFSQQEIEDYAAIVTEASNNGKLSSVDNTGRMEYLMNQLSDVYNFTWSKGPVSDISSSLSDGNAVISLINSSSHFVAITGILEDGNVIVNDSDGNKYRADVVLRDRVDNTGFNLKNNELKISAARTDKNGDGLDDDVWYLTFDNSVKSVITAEEQIDKVDNADVSTVNNSRVNLNLPYTEVPLYFQTDYEDVKYGPSSSDTVASDGCGITSLAMVSSYLTGKEYLPNELAVKFASKATGSGSCWTLFRDSQEFLGVNVEQQTGDWNKAYAALKNGQVVIANAREQSVFTGGGHYIVLTGVTEDGKILVNDPYKGNYERTDHSVLMDGFENGFDPSLFNSDGEMAQFWIYEAKNPSVQVVEKSDNNVFDEKTNSGNLGKIEPEVQKPTQPIVQPEPEVQKPTQSIVQPKPEVQKPTEPIVRPEPEVQKPTQPIVQPEPEVQKPTQPIVQPETEVQKPTQPIVQPEPEVQKPIESDSSINSSVSIPGNSNSNNNGNKIIVPGILASGLALLSGGISKIIKNKKKNDDV